MRAYSKVYISDDVGSVFGPGVLKLLRGIQDTGSVKEAASDMKLSYSKALKILKKAEKYLGFEVVEKYRGGDGGGESVVTEEGKRLIESYDMLCNEVDRALESGFKDYFSWMEEL